MYMSGLDFYQDLYLGPSGVEQPIMPPVEPTDEVGRVGIEDFAALH